jgi:transcriptional regulator with XRE-family HTH domain
MASFPQNFANLLAEHGWNQNVAAEKLGVSQANVSRWLAGEREPGLTAVIQIAQGLGVTVDELLGSSGTAKLKSRMLGTKSVSTERVPPAFKNFKTRFRAADPVLRDFMVGQIRALFGPEVKQVLAWLNTL